MPVSSSSVTSTSRRSLLASAATLSLGGMLGAGASVLPAAEVASKDLGASVKKIRYCLNMSTVRGQKLTLPQQVKLAADAGYQAIEPWIPELRDFVKGGGSLPDLKKQISDAGLTVESAIGFAEWIVDDDAKRAAGLENAKQDMDLVKSIGGKRIAAPPAGATNQADLNLFRAAERYRALLDLGQKMEVKAQLEVWGFSKCLSKLSEVMFVAVEAKHPEAILLPDIYHLYKGDSGFDSLRMISGNVVEVFHMNDYPAEPSRTEINDAARVYPGDGVAPLTKALRDLLQAGFAGVLSLELFNPNYWKQDALEVAKTGLAKMKASVEKAIG